MPHLYRESPNTIICPQHGAVAFTGRGDFIGDSPKQAVTLYCPECLREEQARHAAHPNNPYPTTGESPSVITNRNRGD